MGRYKIQQLNNSYQPIDTSQGRNIYDITATNGVPTANNVDPSRTVATISESGLTLSVYAFTGTTSTIVPKSIVCKSLESGNHWYSQQITKWRKVGNDYYLDTISQKDKTFPRLVATDFTKEPNADFTNSENYLVPAYKIIGWFNYSGRWFLYCEEVNTKYQYLADCNFADMPYNLDIYEPTSNISIKGNYTEGDFSYTTNGVVTVIQNLHNFDDLDTLLAKYGLGVNIPSHFDRGGDILIKIMGNPYKKAPSLPEIRFRVKEFTNVVTKISQKTADYKVYVGKKLTQDIFNNFELLEIKSNVYKKITNILLTSLNIDSSQQNYYGVDEPVIIKYLYQGKVYEYPTGKMPINLALGEEKWRLMVGFKKTYNFGDILNLRGGVDFAPSGSKLVYQDGETIELKSGVLFFNGAPTASTTLTNPEPNGTYIIDEKTPDFDITIHYNLRYFGELDYTYRCTAEGEGVGYAVSGELIGAKTNFNVNEILEFGDTAVVKLYNNQGIELPEQEIASPFFEPSKISTPPIGYGEKIAKNLYVDKPINRSFRVKDRFNVDWFITTNFYNNFAIDTSKVKKTYFDSGNFNLDIETIRTNIGATIEKHNAGVIEIIDVDKSQLTFRHDPIEVDSGSKIYTIYVDYTDSFNDKHTQSFQITVIRVAPTKIVIDTGTIDTTDYYDNGFDLFHLPTGLTFKYLNNDGTFTSITEQNLTKVFNFYRTKNFDVAALEVGKSVVRPSDGTLIYIKDKALGITGSYTIKFIPDEIVSVVFDSSSPKVDLTLGNRFVSIKKDLKIKALFTSGRETILNQSDYEITKKDIVLEPTDLTINYLGQDYNLGQSQLSFVQPSVENIELLHNGFQTTYTNKADTIDCRNIEIVVKYVNCEYIQHISYGTEPITGLFDAFFVKSSVNLNISGSFEFDGSTIINTDMQDQSSVLVPLTFTFNKKFGGETTKTLDIYVLEVFDITGLSLKNIKNTYYVGETLLNESDETVAVIFYKDKSGLPKKMETKLNSGFDSINIVPGKGTKLLVADNSFKVTITSATNHDVQASYIIRVIPKISANNTKINNIVAVKQSTYTCPKGEVITDKYLLVDSYYQNNLLSTEIVDGVRKFVDGANTSNVKVYGYIEDDNNLDINGKIILFEDYIPPVDGQNNIEVEYPFYIQGNADKINKSHLGILFGSNNTKNRLFVAGNPNFPNTDWHSAKLDNGDLGYFEDTSYCNYGETDSAIVGYSIVSDSKLLVLKNYSDKDTTIWFRTPQLVKALSDTGIAQGINGEVLYQEEFSLIKGNNTVAGVSPKSILNFNGDTLFLSNEKTLCGLDLVGIIGDNQRYANSRSYYIDRELERLVDKDTWVWSNNKYMAIVLKDRVFISHYETLSNKQYEWWLIDIQDVQSIIELNGTIYFGNSKGEFYKINNIYSDVKKIFIGEGGSLIVSQNEDDNKIIVNKTIIDQLKENTDYTFECLPNSNKPESYMYFKIGSISNSKTGTFDFFVDTTDNTLKLCGFEHGAYSPERVNKVINLLNENAFVYLNHYEDRKDKGIETLNNGDILRTYYKKYYLKRYENDNVILDYNAYKLFDENGVEMDITGLLRANLCYRLNGEYEIRDINKETSSFRLYFNNQLVDLVQYAEQPVSRTFKAEIKEYKPVEAFYITKPYTMGSLNYFKTVWSFTLTNDTNIPSELNLTYANNKVPFEKMKSLSKISVDSLSFSMDQMSFKKIDFDKQIVPRTYTNDKVLNNLKFICLGFVNYNNTNSVLSSMSIIYSTPTQAISGD